jgi:hypothetical protein
MESFGLQTPTGRRRQARVHSDNKRSGDLGVSDETVPELVALHMEYKIQRERLAAWGKEWGDDRIAAEGNFDESFARADLTEAVTDVLQNINNIMDEKERISSGNAIPGGVGLTGEKIRIWGEGGVERRWSQTDRARYEQLASELKSSIDLLYDISTNRKEIRDGTYSSSGKGKSEIATQVKPPPTDNKSFFMTQDYTTSQETLVNPTRSLTRTSTIKTAASLELPPRLDPSLLELPGEEPPPYDSAGATPLTRMIAHLRLPGTPSSSSKDDTESVSVPVLIEYAPYDPTYRSTGVSVPTNRLDSLLNFYARCGSLVDFSAYGTLSCLGYFEDPNHTRFGLVYEIPHRVAEASKARGRDFDPQPVSLLKVLQSTSKSLNSANRALPPGPPLEDRFRLAFNILQTFNRLHTEEQMPHKDVNSSNVVFFLKTPVGSGDATKNEYDVRTPYLSSFDLFSEYSIEPLSSAPGRNLYRRPDDPRISDGVCQFCSRKSLDSCKCAKYRFDIYGLGVLLLEVGLWLPLSDLFKVKYSLEDFKRRIETIWVRKLASKTGSIYMNVVRECLQLSSQNVGEGELRGHYDKWLRRLQKCCLLDEEDSHMDAGFTVARTRNTVARNVPTTSPESTLVASRRASNPTQTALPQQSNNPFVTLHTTPNTNTSFFSNPFSRFTASRTSLPQSIKESGEEHLLPWNTTTTQIDERSETTFRGIESTQPRSEADNASISSTSTRYQKAAKVIQRAWRFRNGRDSFNDYKRKITIVQKQWRKRKELCGSRATKTQPPVFTKEIVSEPEIHQRTITEDTHMQIHHEHIPAKPKLRLHTVKLTAGLLDQWHDVMLPRLERIMQRALKDSPETVSIDLIGVGETALTAKPTVFITCSSTARVRGAINRKFAYDHDVFDVKIRRGKVRRSKVTRSKKIVPPHRSMMNESSSDATDTPLNPFHQERPLCGASIGAYVGNKHLPPVSYGGVVRIDGEPFGMTVHHLLDSPSEDDSEYGEDEAAAGAERSSARRSDGFNQWLAGMAGHPTLQTVPTDSMFPLEISDDDDTSSGEEEFAEFSDEEEYSTSDEESEDDSVNTKDTGDLQGILPGDGSKIFVTQPALDDVDEDFFPSEEDKDDDHLDSHKLGHVHASSGIRRWKRNDLTHEIDWALLKLDEDRLQPYNVVQGGRKHLRNPTLASRRTPKLAEPVCRGSIYQPEDDEYPVKIAKSNELGNLRVHCFGRTSGLQGGVISEAMSLVKIYGRTGFSHSWHVVGNFGS